jgi:DnaJ-domain-containing protein 1
MFESSKLPGVLIDLGAKTQSGVLRVENASARKQLILHKGLIAFAESDQADEHLAHMMVALNYLKKSDIREVIALMKSGKNSEEASRAISKSGEEALARAVREQVIVVLSSILGWDDCKIRFFGGENLIQHRTNMKMAIPETLVVSARRAASRRLIKLPPEFFESTLVSNLDLPEARRALPLNGPESYACTRTLDSIPARELMELIPVQQATADEVLQSLYVLGLIGIKKKEDASLPKTDKPSEDEISLEKIEEMMSRFEDAGFYEILGVEKEADAIQVRTAYHNLAKEYHPDRFQSDRFSESERSRVEQVFSRINQAYMTLRDPDLRSKYDGELQKWGSRPKAQNKASASAETAEDETIEALFRLGRRSLVQGEFEKAAKELKSCVHLRPDNAQYNYFLGLAESEVPALYKSAEQHFFKVIEMEPMSIDARIALVKLYMKVQLRRKANLTLDEVLRWDPDNPEAAKLRVQINKI